MEREPVNETSLVLSPCHRQTKMKEAQNKLNIPTDDLNMGGFPGGGAPVGLSVG